MGTSLSTDLDRDDAVPYFLWDDPMTLGEFKRRLATSSPAERARLIGLVLREARERDVWRFVSPQQLVDDWPAVSRHLGRRRPFWVYLLGMWAGEGLVHGRPA